MSKAENDTFLDHEEGGNERRKDEEKLIFEGGEEDKEISQEQNSLFWVRAQSLPNYFYGGNEVRRNHLV